MIFQENSLDDCAVGYEFYPSRIYSVKKLAQGVSLNFSFSWA